MKRHTDSLEDLCEDSILLAMAEDETKTRIIANVFLATPYLLIGDNNEKDQVRALVLAHVIKTILDS